jgi:outer membrane lipoprotein SlyB
MKRRLSTLLVALSLAACATVPPAQYVPVIDTQGVDPKQYQSDLFDCQQFARQIDRERSAANAAIAGAIFMGVLSAALGGHTRENIAWAGAGAAAAGGQAAAYAGMSQVQIIKNCMAGRGYKVLL